MGLPFSLEEMLAAGVLPLAPDSDFRSGSSDAGYDDPESWVFFQERPGDIICLDDVGNDYRIRRYNDGVYWWHFTIACHHCNTERDLEGFSSTLLDAVSDLRTAIDNARADGDI